MSLSGKKILIGITGGIAAYKVAFLIRLLKKAHADVKVIMTEAATKFIGTTTIQALTEHPVYLDTFATYSENGIEHISLAQGSDLMLIAPATANTIAKIRIGIADNLLTSVALAATCPIMIAPAMNMYMYKNPATIENIDVLKNRNYLFVGPNSGSQACGDVGLGRMSEPEEIFENIQNFFSATNKVNNLPLLNKKVVITAGPTRESIDPVRYITNKSSGKMGYALAQIAKDLGASVTLVSGPVNITASQNINLCKVTTADEMLECVKENIKETDIFIACAAVADYKLQNISTQKIKKISGQNTLTLNLVENPDILAHVGHMKQDRPKLVVGFAAETQNLEEYALKKLDKKNADMIIANNVSNKNIGFDSDKNEVIIFSKENTPIHIGPISKLKISAEIFNYLLTKL